MKMIRIIGLGLVGAAVALLAGCGDDAEPVAPAARDLTRDAIGHYCNMIVADHPGPKGQIFVAGRDQPYWFSSVRDAVAFTKLPEEPRNITAIYVNDMARAATWKSPEPGTWMDARAARFVIESSRRGGMGALEAVPFSDDTKAQAFVQEFGGRIVTFDHIPKDYIFAEDKAPADTAMNPKMQHEAGHDQHKAH